MSYFIIIQSISKISEQQFNAPLLNQVSQILGEKFNNISVRRLSDERTIILTFERDSSSNIQFTENSSYWSISSGQLNTSELSRSLRFRGGVPYFKEAVWGRYAIVVGSKISSTLHAWQTIPCLESICYSQSKNFSVYSNSPLLASMTHQWLSAKNTTPQYSDQGISDYLNYGYTVLEETMFENIKKVLPRKMISSNPNGLSEFSHSPSDMPHSLDPEHSLLEAGEALQTSLENSFLRSVENLNGRIDMRISGGKDSRIMLGLAKKFDVPVSATCVGSGEDSDSRIANYLSHEAGYEFTCRNAPVYSKTNLWSAAVKSLQSTLGIPQSEAHFTPNRFFSDVADSNTIMFGNWPAYHGVYHRKMMYSKEEIKQVISNTSSIFVREEIRELSLKKIYRHCFDLSTNNSIEILYHFGLNIRGSNWLSSAFIGWSSISDANFFMSDQELTSLADSLTMHEHISYAPEFIALSQIWPLAARVPLSNNRWRFENSAPSDNPILDPLGFAERDPSNVTNSNFPAIEPNKKYDSESIQPLSAAAISEICEYLKGSPSYHLRIAPLIDTSIHDAINERNVSNINFNRYIWRIFSLTVALSLDWYYQPNTAS